jgi:hypothetical protein
METRKISTCPVCGLTYDLKHCPLCGWEMESEYVLGELTPEDIAEYKKRIEQAHQRRQFKLEAYFEEGALRREGPLEEQQRILGLLGYESEGRSSRYWSQPDAISDESILSAIREWLNSKKRAFTREEVLNGMWVKIGDHGWHHIVQFHPDGTLAEKPLFPPGEESWEGSWRLVGPVLRVNIGPYEMDIFASRGSNIHSGVEVCKDYPGQFHCYQKVVHVL